MKTCAIIPVYNNIGTIADVANRCLEAMSGDVLVVSDGSTDKSDEAAEKTGARVLRIEKNKGKGFAIRRGLIEAEHLGYTHGATIDADGQHPPEELPRLIAEASRDQERIWIGVRKIHGGGLPPSSNKGRAISNFWATLNGWQRSFDTQSGFRIYPIRSTLELNCREDRFTFEMEVLVKAAWAGIKLGHIDVEVIYQQGLGRVTHFDMRRDNLAFSWLSFKQFWGMVVRLPVLIARKL